MFVFSAATAAPVRPFRAAPAADGGKWNAKNGSSVTDKGPDQESCQH